jgi:hypothetical protein
LFKGFEGFEYVLIFFLAKSFEYLIGGPLDIRERDESTRRG